MLCFVLRTKAPSGRNILSLQNSFPASHRAFGYGKKFGGDGERSKKFGSERNRNRPRPSTKATKKKLVKGPLDTQLPSKQGDLVHGLHPTLTVLGCNFRKAYRLFVLENKRVGAKGNTASKIEALAKKRKIPIEPCSKAVLDRMCKGATHQGFIVDVAWHAVPMATPAYLHHLLTGTALANAPVHTHDDDADADADADATATSVVRLPQQASAAAVGGGAVVSGTLQRPVLSSSSRTQPLVLAVDQIWDPQNLGAILRSAAFLGASAVVLSTKESVTLTATVVKASSGASEVLLAQNRLFACTHIPKFLGGAGSLGWQVVGASVGDNALLPNQAAALLKDKPTILVMGNEGVGLRPNVLDTCHQLVSIPEAEVLSTPKGVDVISVGSLNVSAATAILLQALL